MLRQTPALPGWADFWCRPCGPGLQTPLSHVHSSLDLPQTSRLLLMANRQICTSSTVVSHISRKTSEMWGTRSLLPEQEARHLIFRLATASRLLGMTKERVGFQPGVLTGIPGLKSEIWSTQPSLRVET